jgi:hypothetical protein
MPKGTRAGADHGAEAAAAATPAILQNLTQPIDYDC